MGDKLTPGIPDHLIYPRGAPGSQSTEIRWFSKRNDDIIAGWFDENMARVKGDIEERTDTYFVKNGMEAMSIKKRNGKFEIKQRIALSGKIHLGGSVCGHEEHWYKWVLDDAAGKALESSLAQHHYRLLQVTKTRRALKLAADPANAQVRVHTLSDDLPAGYQVEYTSITVNNAAASETWYSFALESFGDSAAGLPSLKGLALFTQIQLQPEDSYAYPLFLARNFIN